MTIYSNGSKASIHAYNFYINNEGKIYAKAGEIGGFVLDSTSFSGNTGVYWCGINSSNGKFCWQTMESYIQSQQSTPVTLTAPVNYVVALDNAEESTLNLPSSDLPGGGSSTSMIIIHQYGTGLGANKYHINGNGYKINVGGSNLDTFDLPEGKACLLVWEPRSADWYVIGL